MKQNVNIILASASPRRKELLKQVQLNFTVITSQADEVIKDESRYAPNEIVRELAKQKVTEIYKNLNDKYFRQNNSTIKIGRAHV